MSPKHKNVVHVPQPDQRRNVTIIKKYFFKITQDPKMIAYGGAIFVPIAVPLSCL